jgi:hypothetical protein
MTPTYAFLLGVMVALTPSTLFLAILLWKETRS